MAAAGGRAKLVAETASRIFGTWIGDGLRSGRKVLRQKMIGEEIASYYMEAIKDPLLDDPSEARRVLMHLPARSHVRLRNAAFEGSFASSLDGLPSLHADGS